MYVLEPFLCVDHGHNLNVMHCRFSHQLERDLAVKGVADGARLLHIAGTRAHFELPEGKCARFALLCKIICCTE